MGDGNNWLCRESWCLRERNDGILECWNVEDPPAEAWV
ncbi:hypothetical protein D1AOALGA4SA_12656 [Olavius algarvensis Delta 1 endosymbiont]|nr:hypothetical protein D1AOALGA4SA_12656 [Olavius algarvensis Delta 1 endosymbiont]